MTKQNYSSPDLCFDSLSSIQTALEKLTVQYLTPDVSPHAFRVQIQRFINNNNGRLVDQYPINVTTQNPLLTTFLWGHDHDFGTFHVSGLMGTRHIWMLSRFFDHFGLSPEEIRNKKILDVGCWTGGVSLILNQFGGTVVAIDEIESFIEVLSYLIWAFGLKNIEAHHLSLYELYSVGIKEEFDLVFFLGTLYHLSDPIIGLRQIYNVLKPHAILCLETMSIYSDECICEYHGPSLGGGNWFVPSPRAVYQMLVDSGFEVIRLGNGLEEFAITNAHDPMGANRCFAIAHKKPNHEMYQIGLSTRIS